MDSPLLSAAPSPAPTAVIEQTPNPQPKSLETPPDFCAQGLSKTPPRTQPEQLPCPRCDSLNTKFCYYNNYNLSQPRHFCKSCRRYWTRGGALRNVPIGGGTRKSASAYGKRPRRKIAAAAKSDGVPVPSGGDGDAAGRAQTLDPDLEPGSVGCFWSKEEMGSGGGDFLFNGYGLGPGPGYEQASLDWPVEQDGGPLVIADEAAGFGTWQIGGGGDGGGALESDCFTWPDLAISTPAEGLK